VTRFGRLLGTEDTAASSSPSSVLSTISPCLSNFLRELHGFDVTHRPDAEEPADVHQSFFGIVSHTVRGSRADDAEGLAVFRARATEPDVGLETVLKELRRRGKLQPREDRALGRQEARDPSKKERYRLAAKIQALSTNPHPPS
jgi:hypothetical protein